MDGSSLKMRPDGGFRSWRRALLYSVLLLGIFVGFFWKLVLTKQYTWIDSPDLVHLEVPRLQFQLDEYRAGRLPLWDPYHWAGQPFLGQVVGAASPLHWPLFLFPPGIDGKISVQLLHWYYVLIHFLGALFAFWWCRDLGCSPGASLAGCLVFPLSGFFGTNGWPPVMAGIVWAPLVFLFLCRVVRGRNPAGSAALSGMFLGLSWLGGHHEVPIYLSFAAAFLWLYLVFSRPEARIGMLGLAALSMLCAVLTSGLQTVPGYEFGKQASRWAGTDQAVPWALSIPYTVHSSFSTTPGSIVGLVIPWSSAHVDLFVGITALSLAIVGVIAGWREPAVRILTVTALAALFLAMAWWNVLHGFLYSALPLFGKARIPARLISIMQVCLPPLAAFGVMALLKDSGLAAAQRVRGVLITLGGAVLVLALAAAGTQSFTVRDDLVFTALAAIVLGCVWIAWSRQAIGSTALIACMVILMLVELGNISSSRFPNRHDRSREMLAQRLTANSESMGYLRRHGGLARTAIGGDPSLTVNFGDWDHIYQMDGFGAAVTTNLIQLDFTSARTRDLLGVRYEVGREPSAPGPAGVFEAKNGMQVFERPGAFPRTWVVQDLVPVRSREEIRRLIADPEFRLAEAAPVMGDRPELEACAAGQSRVISHASNRVTLEANLNCRGMVVLADTWFPGWEARIDGKPARIYEVYGALRGVAAEAGSHSIEYVYRPASVLAGGIMTLMGVLLTAAVNLRRR